MVLTLQHFVPLVDERFHVRDEGDALHGLSLVAAAALDGPEFNGRRPFALTFKGPATPMLAQGTYRVEHRALGAPSIFLVPVQGGPSEVRYEAVFN